MARISSLSRWSMPNATRIKSAVGQGDPQAAQHLLLLAHYEVRILSA